jgi:alpha-tubulin suppressor-like RCC1 family protein
VHPRFFLFIACLCVGCIAASDLPSPSDTLDSGVRSREDGGEPDRERDGAHDSRDGAHDGADDAQPDDPTPDATVDGGGRSPMDDAQTAHDAEADGESEGPSHPDAGDGSTSDEDRPVRLALAEHHSCLLTAKGKVFCWGGDQRGQLGDGTDAQLRTCDLYDGASDVGCRPTPAQVSGSPAMPPVTQLSAGAYTTCALHEARAEDGSNLSCWGSVVDGTQAQAPAGIDFGGTTLDDVIEVKVGGLTTCVRRDGKPPVCWGEFGNGELGNGDTSYQKIVVASALVERAKDTEIRQLAIGDQHGCARLANGEVVCWGNNAYGQTGQPTETAPAFTEPVLIPAALTSIASVTNVAVGGDHTCVLVDNGNAYCNGHAADGQLGFGDTAGLDACYNAPQCSATPLRVVESDFDGARIKELAPGYRFTCARLTDDRVFCWGNGQFRQLGPKVQPYYWRNEPIDTMVTNAVHVAAGGNHACAILKDHSVVCWGRNDAGQLGVPPEDTPTVVGVDAPAPSSAVPVTVPKVW